jgi:hypothetical protein
LGQEVQHVLNGAPPSANRQSLQNLGAQNKCSNDQSGEELADGQSGHECNGHRQFHRHAPLDDVLHRFLEDGIAADQSGCQSYYADAMEWLPQMKPDRCRRECYKQNTEHLYELEGVLMAVLKALADHLAGTRFLTMQLSRRPTLKEPPFPILSIAVSWPNSAQNCLTHFQHLWHPGPQVRGSIVICGLE